MTSGLISKRGRITPASPIRKLSPLADKARKSGTKIYHLNIGQPDIESPKEFLEGIKEFHQDVVAYEPSQGCPALCKAWAKQMSSLYKLDLTAENFLITTGASEALVFAFMVCCDPEDEIIIFDPSYANYRGFSAIAGVELVPVPTHLEEGFHLPTAKKISDKITGKTKAILVCNPNNPTGTVYSREELQQLLGLCNERNLFLIIDETYREFVYDGLTPFSIFELSGARERAIVIDSLSKRYSLCGARVGALITYNEEVLSVAIKIAQVRLSAATIEQYAAAHMLEQMDETFVRRAISEYHARRETMHRALTAIPGAEVFKPQGAFYTVARLPVKNAESFCSFLLSSFSYQGATTFLAPAAGFYLEAGRGEQEVRTAYVLNSGEIEKAVEVVKHAIPEYLRR